MTWQDWIRTVEVAPVLVPGPPDTVASQVDALVRTGCRIFHLHVRWDLAEFETARLVSPLIGRYDGVLELQIEGPLDADICSEVLAAGGSSVTFQLGPWVDPEVATAAARSAGLQVGIAFDRSTDLTEAAAWAAKADLVRCPGGPLLDQLRDVRLLSQALPPGVVIQVGGGINHENARDLYEAGARVFLVRTAIFSREDLPRSYRRLVQAFA
jgi:2-keto-3-deoxy-6-phosphogluconate aldolase